MTRPILSKRQKKLNQISVKIAMFVLEDTFTDEAEAQKILQQALGLIESAIPLLGGHRMGDLSALTTAELQKELARRNQPKPPKPEKIHFQKCDFGPVERMCIEYVNAVEDGDVDDDWPHYIFEAAVEAVYGKSIWEWIREQTQ